MSQTAPGISTYCTERPCPWEVVPYVSEAKDEDDEGQVAGLQRTPIRSLPVELLRKIFELGLELLSMFPRCPKYLFKHSQYQVPLSLLRVCRVWRQVALDTGSLWNSIAPSQNSVAFMRRWLEMSPKVPLNLSLPERYLTRNEDNEDDEDNSIRMFRLFAEEAYRWQSLSILLNEALATELLALMESNINTPLPIKHLTIRIDLHEALPREIAGIIRLLTSFKSLERLHWACLAKISLQHIPWSQLKVAIIHQHSSAGQIMNYLSKCTSSRTVCFLPFSKHQDEDLPFPQRVQRPITSLPKLTSLMLSRFCDPIRMLQFFDLPSLRTLHIEVQKRDLVEIEQLLKRTPSLRSLMIDEWGFRFGPNNRRATDQDILGYLTSPVIRCLPRFKITFYKAYNRGFEIIMTHPDPENAFPQLVCWKEKLFVYIGWGFDVDEATQLLWKYNGGIPVSTP